MNDGAASLNCLSIFGIFQGLLVYDVVDNDFGDSNVLWANAQLEFCLSCILHGTLPNMTGDICLCSHSANSEHKQFHITQIFLKNNLVKTVVFIGI